MSCSRYQIVLQAAVALLLLAGANKAVSTMSKTTRARQLLRAFEQPDRLTGIAIGNSLMEAGFDTAAFSKTLDQSDQFAKAGDEMFANGGLGSTSPVEHLLLLRKALSHHPEIRTVIYGFFDLQLTQPPSAGWSDLTGNRAMAYYTEPELAAEMYAPHSPWFALRMKLIGHVPLLVERLAVWAKVERMRRSFAAIGMPAEQTNQFGRAADFSALESDSSQNFAISCRDAVQNHEPLTSAVDELLRECSEHRPAVDLVIVCMPMSPLHLQRFYSLSEWSAYVEYLRTLLKDRHCTLVMASDWVSGQQHFADNLHLNSNGADLFSQRLASEIRAH